MGLHVFDSMGDDITDNYQAVRECCKTLRRMDPLEGICEFNEYRQNVELGDTMKKAKVVISLLWISLVGVISPVWLGGTYLIITGQGKGYAYDMGPEAGVSVFFGLVMLLVWLLSVTPVMIWLCRRFFTIKRVFAFIPIAVFISCFTISTLL